MNDQKMSQLGLYSYVIGGAIGAGMFITLPSAIESTGLSIVLAIVITSILVFFAYFYCTAISAFAPVKGGDYGHIAFVAPPLISGVFGLTTIFYIVGNCVYTTGALEYASLVFPAISKHMKLLGFLLLTLFAIIDYLGVNLGEKVATTMTITLTISVIALILTGLPSIDTNTFASSGASSVPFFKNGFVGFSKSIGLCVWVVAGVGTTAITFTRFVKKPTRSIPKSIIVGTIVLGIIGCLLCIVCAGAVPEEVAVQGLGAVAAAVMPRWMFFIFVIGGAGFALLTSLQAFIVGYSQGLLEYAEQGFLPRIFKKTNKHGYPWVVGIFMWLLSVVPFLFDITLDTIVSYTGAPVYFCLVYVNYKCMKLPEQYPEAWNKCMLHMPLPIWKGICGISSVCAVYLVYCYCADFTLIQLVQMALTIAAMFGWSYYRMKAKHVDVAAMEKEREEIIQEAISYEA